MDCGCDGEENEKRDIGALYSAYYSQAGRDYFIEWGLLNQGKGYLCRTLQKEFDNRDPGTIRSTARYSFKSTRGRCA